MIGRIVVPRRVEVVVSSFGGVGTTLLAAFTADRKPTNCAVDADGLKHSHLPPLSLNPDCRFVYLYGSPQLAAASLFRRQLHSYHSGKMRRLAPSGTAPIPFGMTIEEYALEGVDRLHFRAHFENWYRKYPLTAPTMFIRYEALFDNLNRVFDFLRLPQSQIPQFPEQRPRKSTEGFLTPRAREGLDALYGDFAAELSQVGDIEVRPASPQGRFSGEHLTRPYLMAFLRQAPFEAKFFVEQNAPSVFQAMRRAFGRS